MSSIQPPSKKKSIEKQAKQPIKSSTKLSKSGVPVISSQRTSLKIGQKITADGVVDPVSISPSPKLQLQQHQQDQIHQQLPIATTNILNDSAIIQEEQVDDYIPNQQILAEAAQSTSRNLYESSDILSRMVAGQSSHQQSLGMLPSFSHQLSNESNQMQNSFTYKNSTKHPNHNNHHHMHSFSSVESSSLSSSASLTRKDSNNKNQQQQQQQLPQQQQTSSDIPPFNGLNFTFMEEEQQYPVKEGVAVGTEDETKKHRSVIPTTNALPHIHITNSNNNHGTPVVLENGVITVKKVQDRLGEIPPLDKTSAVLAAATAADSKHSSGSSSASLSSQNSSGQNKNNNNNGKATHNQQLLGPPPALLASTSQSSKQSLSFSASSGMNRFSLADSFVVKKNGRYTDDYENASSSSNSQKDGKKLIMLGRGGFGQVFLIKQKYGAQEERAMKIVPKGFQEAFREVMMLKKFSHPNVLKIYEYFEDEFNIYVITERCYGYNLFDYIILKGQFTESETCKIADGVLRALSEAHKQGIVHRDVKPDNIMLDFNETRDSFTVKLIDWGLADQLQSSPPSLQSSSSSSSSNHNGQHHHHNNQQPQQSEQRYLSKRCGTLHYLAPEVLAKRYNEKVDLWSLGMVLFTLIQGSPPICGKSQVHILEQVQNFQCSFKYSCWKSISDEAKDLIMKLLERDPAKRISAVDALRHPWFARLAGTVVIDTQDLRSSFSNLVKYSQANTFKKTVLGFFASHLITKRERNRFMDIFQVLDTDKNGELSVEELKAGFQRLFSEEEFAVCHSEIESIFFLSLSAKFEGASGIKYEEFLSSMLACSETYSVDSLRQAFKLFDKDSNGKINLDEIINTLEIPPDSDAIASFKQVISSFDENHDGELDFEEFRKVMTNFLDINSQVILSQEIYLS